MRLDWSAFDRPANSSGQLEAQRPWGCEASTSYSTSSIKLKASSVPAHSDYDPRSFSLSWSSDGSNIPGRPSKAATELGHDSKRQRQRKSCAAFASISCALSGKLHKARPTSKPAKQILPSQTAVSFKLSQLQPELFDTRSSCAQSRQGSHQSQLKSYSLSSFQLQEQHSWQPGFASISLAHSRRKRQPVGCVSESLVHPGAVQTSVTEHQFIRQTPVLELAQNSGSVFQSSNEQQHRHNGGADVAEAGRQVKKTVLVMPSQLRRLFAGAFAGALSKTAIAPIETIRMQVMGNKGTVMESIARTWRRKGIFGFFSGNSADILRVMPSKAIELTCFDAYKRMLSHQDDHGHLCRPGPVLTGLAGAAAGATSTAALYPLETLRTRLAMGDYDSLAHAVRTITAEEGFMAFYQGIQASLIGILPYAAIRLGVYDGLKWSHRKVTKKEKIPPVPTALYGAFAGLVSASATFPVEVVRRRMMVGTAKGGTFAALTSIAQQEGWRSLYKGIGLTWVKQAPQYAVTFLAYDKIKELLEV